MGILSAVAVHLKKMKKKKGSSSKRKQLLNNVLAYLKSDTFMFAPLCSSHLSSVFCSPGIEEDKPLEGNERSNIVDYLKDDTYMYAPLVISKIAQRDLLVSKVSEEMDRKRCAGILKGGADKPGRKTVNVVSKDHKMDGFPHTMVTRTRVHSETVEHMIYQTC